jgi:hypothetical protein
VPNTNGSSIAWHAPRSPPAAGEGHVKRYMYVWSWCAHCDSARRIAGMRKWRSDSIASKICHAGAFGRLFR